MNLQEIFKLFIVKEKISNPTILENTLNKISFKDTLTNITYKIELCQVSKIYNCHQALKYTKFNEKTKVYEEEFYDLEKISLKEAKPLFKRAYKDIENKYGTFSLHLEESNTNSQLALYYGNHEQILNADNDFDFAKFGLFKSSYTNTKDYHQWMMGYTSDLFKNPKRNIWYHGLGIYAFTDEETIRQGVILRNGNINLKGNYNHLPEYFEHYDLSTQLEEFENFPSTSKAYFYQMDGILAILKNNNYISIIYKEKNLTYWQWNKRISLSLNSNSRKEFTKEDIEKIIMNIISLDIDEEFKKFIIKELITYLNNEIELTSIENYSYQELLDLISREDLDKLSEKAIEKIEEVFNIEENELLGKHNPNMTLKLAK